MTEKKHTLKKQVEIILAAHKNCRHNDTLLYAMVLNRFYGADIADDRLMLDMALAKDKLYPSIESVSRQRRKFQHMGWFTDTTNREKFIPPVKVVKGHVSIAAKNRAKKVKNG